MQAATANNFCYNKRTNVDNMAQMSGNGQRLFTELYPRNTPWVTRLFPSNASPHSSPLLYLLSVLFSPCCFGHMCLTLSATPGLMWMFSQGWPFYMCALQPRPLPGKTPFEDPSHNPRTGNFRLPKRNIFRWVWAIDEGASHECKDVPRQIGKQLWSK